MLPPYYFRVKENGAAAFRVDADNRNRRIEMDQIASVNVRSGEIKPHGKRTLTPEDLAACEAWRDERAALLERRDWDEVLGTIDRLNLTAQWAQSRATPAQLDEVTDALLLAIHDLRSVLVRKKADRLE